MTTILVDNRGRIYVSYKETAALKFNGETLEWELLSPDCYENDRSKEPLRLATPAEITSYLNREMTSFL